MKRATPIHRSCDERTDTEVFVRRGKVNAHTLTRTHVLLKCHEVRFARFYGDSKHVG